MDFRDSTIKCCCPLCGYSTHNDVIFKTHIERYHGKFSHFKKMYGQCQTVMTGSGTFKCQVCYASVKFISSAVRGHLRKCHRISWQSYAEKIRSYQAGRIN